MININVIIKKGFILELLNARYEFKENFKRGGF